ncbi:predicted protein [Aspergillus nidulans FGSC A4]|uniref:Uncharacterized protein n=1 Tax=Emericella nidulans (strain FGSC A4 / ATCC 38163 / CBS 112.46 / NRRL 194 / M139) TaxID=227321 RepID=Q5BED2_EMENI|nr:hypothetical protein [Aspergillus nidulans FGSC A4]EAA66216.1 predicted protein [Aspergillus nidulans FGSC A4]CBF88149.1 TPA: hypothetical protein ANIA_01098 [Aspergillus nidulans FGSC A4]|eukprot:XP_658702.1 predicted protein [Aspergillus nidulans FGSC A4]
MTKFDEVASCNERTHREKTEEPIRDSSLVIPLITQVDYVCYSLLGFDPLRTLMYGDVIEAPQPLSMNAVRMLDAPPWLL